MKTSISLLLGFFAVSALPSPAAAGDSAFWGTGIGAALGGYLGSGIGKGSGQLAATGAGVFVGGLIGNSIGSSMDRADSSGAAFYSPSYAYQTYEPNYVAPPAPPPPRVVYVQPEVVEYRRVPTPVYVEEGYLGAPPPAAEEEEPQRHCREFTQKIKIDGHIQESYGTACLRPDGTWQIER